ncbi:M28 family peptidase [Actinomadura sp. WAC 06369]|uniref:M28 family peptidase n=1 Tax=Actinomadura sp. WAC 06369 TaxID=2203193 RepID=UPI0018F2E008|nr:M28 family peptidase [Actinomadura sp. WAC 06369]
MRTKTALATGLVTMAAAVLSAAPPSAASAAPPHAAPAREASAGGSGELWLARMLAESTRGGDVWRHLRAFDRIAAQNGGVRSTGTPGFEASSRYAAEVLTAAGYRVYRQHVPYTDYRVDAESATVTAPAVRQVRALVMRWSPGTPPGGLDAHLVVPRATTDDAAGCSAADYDGLPVAGSVVVVRRGSCGHTAQQRVAAGLGAKAMLIYLATPSPDNIYRLHGFDREAFTIPVASIPQTEAERLAREAARHRVRLRLDLRGHEVAGVTTNLFAETRGGGDGRTVIAGAHLDSVSEAPGINDNAAAASALMATALRLAPHQGKVRHRVRFALWGAEELIDIGSYHYVRNLTPDERAEIALYLNFELIAAPNGVRFVLDGDASEQPPGTPPGPPGSGVVEKVFKDYFDRAGLPYESHDLRAVGSDHEPFMAAGVPVGGLNGGVLGVKTAAQAARFGGTAGRLYDPCYHQPCDTIGNLDRRALGENVPAIAWAVGRFALDVSDLPAAGAREQRP